MWAVMAIAAAGENPHDWEAGSNHFIVDYLTGAKTIAILERFKRRFNWSSEAPPSTPTATI